MTDAEFVRLSRFILAHAGSDAEAAALMADLLAMRDAAKPAAVPLPYVPIKLPYPHDLVPYLPQPYEYDPNPWWVQPRLPWFEVTCLQGARPVQ